jgi:hypothetical protein
MYEVDVRFPFTFGGDIVVASRNCPKVLALGDRRIMRATTWHPEACNWVVTAEVSGGLVTRVNLASDRLHDREEPSEIRLPSQISQLGVDVRRRMDPRRDAGRYQTGTGSHEQRDSRSASSNHPTAEDAPYWRGPDVDEDP